MKGPATFVSGLPSHGASSSGDKARSADGSRWGSLRMPGSQFEDILFADYVAELGKHLNLLIYGRPRTQESP